MTHKPHQMNLRLWARNLTAPAANITAQEHRQQARLLASLSAVLWIATLVIAPIWIIRSPAYGATKYISLGILLIIALTYTLSRTAYYRVGALLLTLSLLGLVGITFFTAPGPITERMLTLQFLVIVIMISSLFWRRLTFLIAGLSLATFSAFFFVPDVPFSFAYAYLVFFLVITAIGAAYAQLSGQYKRQLLESEAKYHSVVTNLSEGIILQRHTGVIDACNTAAENILGLTADQIMGRTSLDPRWQAIHEDGSPFPGEMHPAMVTLDTGRPLTEVIMGIHQPNGKLCWISINTQPLFQTGSSKPYAVITSLTDITARKQDERAVQEAQHRYYALFEQSHDAVFILDLQGQHIVANHRAAELLGYSVAEIQHLKFTDLSAEVPESLNILEQLLEGKRFPAYERTFLKKDGSSIPVEINVELVRDLDGRPLHIQSVVRDITERKQTQQRAFELALEKERIRVLTTFVQDASHEFKTPLAIINTTAFVMARLPEAPERQSRVAIIQAQVKRLVKLTDMLLIITRLENNPTEEMQPVDIGKAFDAACQRMISQYDEPPMLYLTQEPELPLVLGYEPELIEAIWQILDNACRFTPEDGVITAVTGSAQDHVWLEIHNTGPGIEAAHLSHIFELFWREDEAHTTPGFGLGLAIAQKIIHKHGGTIAVTSEAVAGSTFRILLPF